MMHFSQRNLKQVITYWSPDGDETNEFGHRVIQAGVEIKGRWEDKIQQVRRADGVEVTSSAMVFVDRDLAVGGYLKAGAHEGVALPADAREIQSWMTIPDLRNLGTERKAYL